MINDPETQLNALIGLARESDLPSKEQLAAGRDALTASLGTPADAAQSSTTHATTNATTHASPVSTTIATKGTIALAVKTGLCVVVAAIVGVALMRNAAPVPLGPRRSVRSPVTAPSTPPASHGVEPPVSAPIAPVAVTPPETPLVVPVVHKPRRTKSGASPETPPAAPVPDDFAAEVALLRRAVEAERKGQLDEARELLRSHAARYPNSQLDRERVQLEMRLSGTQR